MKKTENILWILLFPLLIVFSCKEKPQKETDSKINAAKELIFPDCFQPSSCDITACEEEIVIYHSITREKFDFVRRAYNSTGLEKPYRFLDSMLRLCSCQTNYVILDGDHQQNTNSDINFVVGKFSEALRDSASKYGFHFAKDMIQPVNYYITFLKGLIHKVPSDAIFTFYKAKRMGIDPTDPDANDIVFSVKYRQGGSEKVEYYDVSDTEP